MRINRPLSRQVSALFDAAARGEEVVIERDGQPDLRLMLQSDSLALVAPSRQATGRPAGSAHALAPATPETAPRPARPRVPAVPGAPSPLDDQLAAEELVASIDAHKVGWEPWWKSNLPQVSVLYADEAQLELESRVAGAYGWHRDTLGDDVPRPRSGLAVRLGLAPRLSRPSLTVTWSRAG
jgi:hypothetical protein